MKTCNTSFEPLIASLLRETLGAPLLALTPLPTHPDTIVYEAHTAGQQVVFKAIEPDGCDPDGIALEAWALEAAARQGVPTPRVLAVDTSRARFPSAFFIMEKARGQSLAVLKLPQAEQAPLLRQVGQALRQLHTIQVPGFGWLDEEHFRQTGQVRGVAPTWRAALLGPAPASLDYLAQSGALSSAQVDTAQGLIEKHAGLLDDCQDGRLLHADLGPIHVWVDMGQGRLTSLVDFGNRAAGDPIFDFVDYDWQDVPDIWAGYEPEAALRKRLDEKFYFYALLRALPWAERWHRRGAVHVIQWLSLMIEKAQTMPPFLAGLGHE